MKNDRNELITDYIDMVESFHEKFVSISKMLAAPFEKVSFTTVAVNGKSLLF